MLIITDIDGTLADDRHRLHYLSNNDLIGFFDNSHKDLVNTPGKDLLKEILKGDDEGGKPIIAALTARPEYYVNHQGEKINYRKRTKQWLVNQSFRVDEISMSTFEGTEKLNRFSELVLDHMEETDIFYLENDLELAYAAKERCPVSFVYLVSYYGYYEVEL